MIDIRKWHKYPRLNKNKVLKQNAFFIFLHISIIKLTFQ